MSSLQGVLTGFEVALSWKGLGCCFIGSVLGTAVGVLPGLGPTAAVAMLIPISVYLDPASALIMLAGLFYGSMYGGSITAILVNIPGEAASITTCLDGYAMAKQGRAGAALGISAIGSFVAGTLSVVGLSLLALPLSDLALMFGPVEYFALMVMSLTLIVSLSSKSIVTGVCAAAFGGLLGAIGLDPIMGTPRLTFGYSEMIGGIDPIAVIVGMFAISEIFFNASNQGGSISSGKLKGLWPSRDDIRRCAVPILRGSGIGFLVGLVPGVSPAIAAFLSYDVERKMSRTPQAFGSGAIEGVAGPEAANNSAVGGNLVPLLTLGIPTSPALAVLLGAFMIHGIRPGPTLFSEHADVAWALIASMYIGNVMLLILNLPLAGIWARLARVPYGILAPIVLVFSLLGVYANRNSVFDVWVALAMGLVGWIMRRADFPVVPLVLGLILFPITETSFRQALALEHGSPLVLLTSPIALAFFGLAIVSLVTSVRLSQRGAIVAAAAEE